MQQQGQGGRPFRVTFDRGPAGDGMQKKIPKYMITPSGEAKLKMLDDSDPKLQVLWAIKERGPQTLKEISDNSHLSPARVDIIIKNKEDGLLPTGDLMESKGGS